MENKKIAVVGMGNIGSELLKSLVDTKLIIIDWGKQKCEPMDFGFTEHDKCEDSTHFKEVVYVAKNIKDSVIVPNKMQFKKYKNPKKSSKYLWKK